MHSNSMRLMIDFRDRYLLGMKGCSVLDVGAMIIKRGHSYREIFKSDYNYTGMDIAPGPNVGIVGFENITETYDVVISGQVMEHVNHPWDWLKSLKPYFKKYICIIAPNTWKEHKYPIDTYRYFPDGMRDLFEYAGITVFKIFKSDKDTVGIGIKTDKDQITTLPHSPSFTQLLKDEYGMEEFLSAPIKVPNFYRTNLAKFIGLLGLKKGAEIGVDQGIYSKILCKVIPDIDLLCIDNWRKEKEESYRQAKKELVSYNATLIRKTSMEAIQDIPEGSLDFVYIDATHEFDFFMEDLIAWSRKVQSGGIVAGHDYQLPGVKEAVDTYTKMHNIKEWFLTSDHWPSFFWIKYKNN